MRVSPLSHARAGKLNRLFLKLCRSEDRPSAAVKDETSLFLRPSTLEKLACAVCTSAIDQSADGRISCRECQRDYAYDGTVVDLLIDSTMRTTLEDADYDLRAGYDKVAMDKIADAWITVFSQAGIRTSGAAILEIGAGTGALTVGLLQKSAASDIFAIDLSDQFLRVIAERAAVTERLTLVRGDCNTLPVQDKSFDLIVGRSILHHLLDYDAVLRQCARILKDSGNAIFFEPVLEGKLVIGMYADTVSRLAKQTDDPDFSTRDHNLLIALVRNITKGAWYPQDRDSLAKLEDKYIFSLSTIRHVGLMAGFSSAEYYRDNRPLDPTMWSYFVNTVRLLGIDPAKIHKYRAISEPFANTFGRFHELVCEPMTYICFSK